MNTVIWSRTVRITHWLVAMGVIINFFNETGQWHRLVGYACVLFILLRIIAGFCKNALSSTRFYFPKLQAIKLHIAEIFSGKLKQHAGHNPLGQWAVYLIWVLIFLLAFTGWISRTDAFWGEDLPVNLHVLLSNILQGLVLLHLVAVALMSRLQKKNLLRQMVARK